MKRIIILILIMTMLFSMTSFADFGINPISIIIADEAELVINEEKIELEEAYQKSDYIGYIDALIDNIYFCLGGLVRIGLNADLVEEIFEAIHQCNMAKVKGRKAREVENDSDAIKPENWVSPEEKIIEILEVYRRIKQNNLDCV
jgi:predicted HAD superfamily Cof-like phosphohydrolase